MSGETEGTSTTDLPPGDETSSVGAIEGDNDDQNGTQTENLLESKQCKICNDVLINACRLTCGHYFCRYCIDSLHGPESESTLTFECPVCSEKIGQIENCPEIDQEIEEIFNSLLEGDRLSRNGKKVARAELENALKL